MLGFCQRDNPWLRMLQVRFHDEGFFEVHQGSDLKDLFIYCSDKCNENVFKSLLYSQLLLVTDLFIRYLTRRSSV